MTRLFKKLDITGVAVMLLAFFVAVGFTAAKEMHPTWYEVEITDLNNPDELENQKIGPVLTGSPQFPCIETSGTICAVELQIADGSPVPATMHEADSLSTVQILSSNYRDQ